MPTNASTVDERIVEMRIDNQKFEAGAKKTISILESLDKSLNGISKQNASGFEGIAESLDKVTDRFSVLGIMGDQVIRNLTNSALEMIHNVTRGFNSLTFDQIGAGFDKYAEKTKAVQTIMAATHKDVGLGKLWETEAEQMAYVNQQLKLLNQYTDETSYDLLDMTNNIGKFTSAGRGLDESVSAMMGISNWAAISGGGKNEAARVMYNMSQALGAGAVLVRDWMSVENANMATYEFKEQAIQAAVLEGTLEEVEEGIWQTTSAAKKAGEMVTVTNFRDSLSERWFNTDVLLRVLNDYGAFSEGLLIASEETGIYAAKFLRMTEAYKGMVEGNEEATESWNEYIKDLKPDELETVITYVEELSKDTYDLGRRAYIAAQEAKTFKEAIEATKDAVSSKWLNIFEKIFGDYLNAKGLWTDMAEMLYNVFASPAEFLLDAVEKATDSKFWYNKETGEIFNAEEGESFITLLESAGQSMEDFEAAFKDLDEITFSKLVEKYGSIGEAIKNGAVDGGFFGKVLKKLSDNMGEFSGETVATEGSFESLRDTAMEVLSGKWGNGEARKKALEEAGFDYETIQWLSGNLKGYKDLGWSYEAVTDDLLKAIPKTAHVQEVINGLGINKGVDGKSVYSKEQFEAMKTILENSDAILGQIKDGSLSVTRTYQMLGEMTNEELWSLMSGGDFIRAGIKNIFEVVNNVTDAFGKAFNSVFGFTDALGKVHDASESLGNKLRGFAQKFFEFTEALKAGTEGAERLAAVFTIPLNILKLFGKAASLAFKILGAGLKIAFALLAPVARIFGILVDTVSVLVDTITNGFDLDILSRGIEKIGNKIRDLIKDSPVLLTIFGYIENGLRFISTIITSVFDSAFGGAITSIINFIKVIRDGFAAGGLPGAFNAFVSQFNAFLEEHPKLKEFADTIDRAIQYIVNHLYVLEDALLVVGAAFGAAFGGIVTVASFIINTIKSIGTAIWDFIQRSEVLSSIFNFVVEKIKKVGEVIHRVAGYIKEGYDINGFKGAVDAFLQSAERGIKRLIPGGETIVGFFKTIWGFLSGGAAGFTSTIVSVFNTVRETINGIWNALRGKKVAKGNQGITETLEEAGEAADGTLLKIEEIPGTAESVGERAVQVFNDIMDATTGDSQAFKDRVATLITNLVQGFLLGLRQVRIRDIIAAGWLSVIGGALVSVMTVIKPFRDVPDALNDILDETTFAIKRFAAGLGGNLVLKIAIAVGILAFAIYQLASIADTVGEDKLTYVTTLVAILVLIMTQLVKAANSINMMNNVNIKQFKIIPELGAALVGLGVLAVTLALAMKIITKIGDPDAVKKAFTPIITVIGAMLATVAIIVAMTRKKNYAQLQMTGRMISLIGFGMLELAFAVQSLIVPILIFTGLIALFEAKGIGDWPVVLSGLLIIGLITAFALFVKSLIGALTQATSLRSLNVGKAIFQIGASILLISIAIQALILPIVGLMAAMEFLSIVVHTNGNVTHAYDAIFTELFLALTAVGLLLLGFGALMKGLIKSLSVMKKAEQIKQIGNTILKIAAGMVLLSMALGMLVLPVIAIAVVLKKFETYKEVLTSAGIFVGILAVFTLILIALTKMVSNHFTKAKAINALGNMFLKLGAGMLLFAVALRVLAPAIMALYSVLVLIGSNLKSLDGFIDALRMLGELALILIVFSGAAWLLGKGLKSAAIAFILFSAGLIVLAHALDILKITLPSFLDASKAVQEKWADPEVRKGLLKIGIAVLLLVGAFVALASILKSIRKLTKKNGIIQMLFGKARGIGSMIGSAIGQFLRNLPKYGMQLFTSSLAFLKKNKGLIGVLIAEAVVLIGGFITGAIPTLTETITQAFILLIDSVATSIDDHKEQIAGAFVKLVRSIIELVKETFSGVWDDLSPTERWIVRITGFLLATYGILKKISRLGGINGVKNAIVGTVGGGAVAGGATAGGAVAGAGGGGLIEAAEKGLATGAGKKAAEKMLTKKAAGAGAKLGSKSLLLNPYTIVLGTVVLSAVGANQQVKEQQRFLKDEAHAGLENNIEGQIEAVNRLRESLQGAKDDYDLLSQYDDGSALWGANDEVLSRTMALDAGMEELVSYFNSIGISVNKESINRLIENITDPLQNYIDAIKSAKEKVNKLQEDYDLMVASGSLTESAQLELDAAKAEYNRAVKAYEKRLGNETEEQLGKSYLDSTMEQLIEKRASFFDAKNAYNEAEIQYNKLKENNPNINAIDLADSQEYGAAKTALVELNNATKDYNNILEELSTYLGISSEDLETQLNAADWNISKIDAVKDRMYEVEDIITVSEDGIISLTERMQDYINGVDDVTKVSNKKFKVAQEWTPYKEALEEKKFLSEGRVLEANNEPVIDDFMENLQKSRKFSTGTLAELQELLLKDMGPDFDNAAFNEFMAGYDFNNMDEAGLKEFTLNLKAYLKEIPETVEETSNDIHKFDDSEFGDALPNLEELPKNIEETASKGAVAFDELKSTLESNGFSLKDLFNINSFEELKNIDFSKYGIDLKSMFGVDSVDQLDLFDLTNLISQLDTAKEQLGNEATEIPAGISTSIDANKGMVGDSITRLASFLPEEFGGLLGINSPSKVFYDLSTGIPEGVADGITGKSILAANAISTMIARLTSRCTGLYAKFYTFGVNIISGLVTGIADNLDRAYNAGYQIGEEAKEGAKEATKQNSPSKVFMDIGAGLIEGLVLGVDEHESDILKSMDVLGGDLEDSMGRTMAMVAAVANSDIETSPRIIPVVDLSGISASSNDINGIFEKSYGLSGLSSRASSIAADMRSLKDARDASIISSQRDYNTSLQQLIELNRELVESTKAGGNVYLSDGVIAGMVNRRLGVL